MITHPAGKPWVRQGLARQDRHASLAEPQPRSFLLVTPGRGAFAGPRKWHPG